MLYETTLYKSKYISINDRMKYPLKGILKNTPNNCFQLLGVFERYLYTRIIFRQTCPDFLEQAQCIPQNT